MAEFTRLCEVNEIASSDLATLDSSADWDLICFNFDFPEMSSLKLVPETKQRSLEEIEQFWSTASSKGQLWPRASSMIEPRRNTP